MAELTATGASVLEQILRLQTTMLTAIDEERQAETLARGLAGLPGVSGVAACIGTHARGTGSCQDARLFCESSTVDKEGSPGLRKLRIKTDQREYGALILDVENAQALEPYLPFIYSTADHAALHMENTRKMRRIEESIGTMEARLRESTAEVAESQQRMELALHGADLGTWDWNIVTNEMVINPRWAEMLGYDLSEIKPLADSWQELVHPDEWPQVTNALKRHLNAETDYYETEHRLKHKSGRWIWVLDKGRVIERSADGTPLRACGTHLDITERKINEEKRKLSEERFRSLFDHTDIGFYLIEPPEPVPTGIPTDEQIERIYRGIVVECNDAQARMYGYSRKEEVLGKAASEFHGGTDNPRNVAFLKEWIRRGYRITRALTAEVDRQGHRVWFSNNVLGIVEGGRLVRVWGTQVDVTDVKRAEEAVARERSLSDTIIDSLPGLFYLFDEDGRFLRWNRIYEEVTGYSADEMPRLHPLDIFRGAERELVAERIQEVFETGQSSVEATLYPKEGRAVPYYFTGRRIEFDDRSCLIGMGIDITERKQAEQEREMLQAQLVQAQRIEAIGRLAGGIAHEFNNMLNVIHGNAELLGMRMDRQSPLRQYVREITSAAQRSAQMTGQLLTYARKQTHAPSIIDINQVIDQYKWLLQRLIGEAIDVRFQPGESIWPVRIDPSQLDHILTNLASNARDAIHGIGTVTVATGNVRFDRYNAPADLSPGDYVHLSFSDTGVGMDEVTRQRIFEPYFTTKDVGKGTGLGMATVHGIIKQNNGGIDVWSRPGEGTTFHLYFPKSTENAGADQPEVETIVYGYGETVLVVEDEPQVLDLAETVLETAGYHVIKAATPGEAIDLLREHKTHIDLLLSDVVLPEMSGKEMKARFEAFCPGIATLFMSGYNQEVISGSDLAAENAGFIRKPFTVHSLTRKVREVLDR